MLRRLAFVALIIALPQAGHAWGVAGHAAIADIAEAHMTPRALAEARKLLAEEGLEHLDQVASWADEIRPTRKEASPWHYVDIPLTEKSYDAARDCPKGDCVIEAINRFRAVLADKSRPSLERREALKFLVHFVGDLQMPLHGTENAGDQGGNKVLVSYFGNAKGWGDHPLNLHTVWDASIIDRHIHDADMKPEEQRKAAVPFAAELDKKITKKEIADNLSVDPVAWAMESHDVAAMVVYPGVVAPGAQPPADPVALGADYDARAWPVVQSRLQLGGLRLAAVLNQTLGS